MAKRPRTTTTPRKSIERYLVNRKLNSRKPARNADLTKEVEDNLEQNIKLET